MKLGHCIIVISSAVAIRPHKSYPPVPCFSKSKNEKPTLLGLSERVYSILYTDHAAKLLQYCYSRFMQPYKPIATVCSWEQNIIAAVIACSIRIQCINFLDIEFKCTKRISSIRMVSLLYNMENPFQWSNKWSLTRGFTLTIQPWWPWCSTGSIYSHMLSAALPLEEASHSADNLASPSHQVSIFPSCYKWQ